MAAWTVGTVVLYGTGWEGGAVLAAFFVSSNVVSRLGAGEPGSTLLERVIASGRRPRGDPVVAGGGIASDAGRPRNDSDPLDTKGNRRDAWQVYANGGPAAVAAAMVGVDMSLRLWLVTASLAAAAADTWATSVGTRSRVAPRLLWSGRRVPPGTSGGVTLAGSAGAAIGALIVASTAALVSGRPLLMPAGTLIGFLGMLADSAIGGALQGRFYCPRCNQPSEWRVHHCACATEWKGGLIWMTNDVVNFIATGLAVGAAAVVWRWLD